MSKYDLNQYRLPLSELRSRETITTVNASELKLEEMDRPNDTGIRVWLIEDDGNPNPYKVTGMIEIRHGSGDGPAWHIAEHYNAEDPSQHEPGPFAHNFQ